MDIMQKAINSQITFLKNINASFKIQLPDGQVFVHDPNHIWDKPEGKRFKRNPDVKRGEAKDFVMPFIAAIEPGQSVNIPLKFHVETVRCLVGDYARKVWGKSSHLTQTKPDTGYMTVIRIL